MILTVHVEQSDIRAGVPCQASETPTYAGCPVVIATTRALEAVGICPDHITVSSTDIAFRWSKRGPTTYSDLPKSATSRIRHFDLEGWMDPWNFALDVAVPSDGECATAGVAT